MTESVALTPELLDYYSNRLLERWLTNTKLLNEQLPSEYSLQFSLSESCNALLKKEVQSWMQSKESLRFEKGWLLLGKRFVQNSSLVTRVDMLELSGGVFTPIPHDSLVFDYGVAGYYLIESGIDDGVIEPLGVIHTHFSNSPEKSKLTFSSRDIRFINGLGAAGPGFYLGLAGMRNNGVDLRVGASIGNEQITQTVISL